jgi:hypothetical protein
LYIAPWPVTARGAEVLSTKYVYVDTQQWRQIAFNWNSELAQAIVDGVKAHRVTLLMTDIVDREITAQLERGVIAYVNALKKTEDGRPFSWGAVMSPLQNTNWPALKTRLLAQLNQQKGHYFRECNAHWVNHTQATLSAVLIKYFATQLPFEDKASKKSEFPDAIALESLKEWCNANRCTTYVVSQDQGVKNACLETDTLKPVDTLADLIREMNAGSEDDLEVKRILTEHNSELAEEIADRLLDMFPFMADEAEDTASVDAAEVHVIDNDLLSRPAANQYQAVVRSSARITVSAQGDDERHMMFNRATGELESSQTRTKNYVANLDADFIVNFRLVDGKIHFHSVEPVGSEFIELSATWAGAEPYGPVKAYLADPGGIPF